MNLAVHDLRRLGLLGAAGWPDRPLLFAEVAARWRPRWFGLAEVPSRSGLDAEQTAVLRLGRGHVLEPGWASASVGADALATHGLDDPTGDGGNGWTCPTGSRWRGNDGSGRPANPLKRQR